jgi:hypothetical protein
MSGRARTVSISYRGRAALRRAHAIARQFVPDGVSLADELIAERWREAE